ncbi:unnamed protein product [Linum tenue]|uniref:START domain-containing protein n=1 Tax=Linum tenue TaxID=586396 RepID=A0AAV0JG83_9ROSI|nr:unnamed protein product [Linum tenue]
MALWSILLDILQRPSPFAVMAELSMLFAPLWIAVFVGVLVGWSWRPKWAILANQSDTAPQSPASSSFKLQLPSCISWISSDDSRQPNSSSTSPPPTTTLASDSSSSQPGKGKSGSIVSTDDLQYLAKLVEVKDGGPAWIQMMDRSTQTMSYQAWRRDPESGPPQYRSRTVYEDATPEMLRDFFWDDEFRKKWDDMLIHSETLEECPTTGTMMVQWVRKFPFFCSDREYIIGRRIWESGRKYYCVTKIIYKSVAVILFCFVIQLPSFGVEFHSLDNIVILTSIPFVHPQGVSNSVPRRNKPRRVDLYYSSWCIRAVESKRDGQLTACEVLLFHYEDMGIPWEIAKLGIRQGMWGAVKKIEPGLRLYQKERGSGAPLSRPGYMAQINSKVSPDYLRLLENSSSSTCSTSSESEIETSGDSSEKAQGGGSIPKVLVVGGAIALACTLDRGLLTKAVIFGVARRFAKMGRRL